MSLLAAGAREDGSGVPIVQPWPRWIMSGAALGLANLLFLQLMYGTIATVDPRRTLWDVCLLAATLTVARQAAGATAGAWLAAGGVCLVIAATCAAFDWPHELVAGQVMGIALMLGLVACERRTWPPLSLTPYVLAAAGATVLGAVVWGVVLSLGPVALRDEVAAAYESGSFPIVHPVYEALHWLLFGGAFAILYGERRLAELALGQLRQAESQHIERSREVVESRLQALQARVDPQFLFDALSRARELYANDPGSGERMLDELVAFLRAAMPHLKDTSSTLWREMRLVEAYLRIRNAGWDHDLSFAIDAPQDIHEAKLPAMLLLPLVHALLAGDDAATPARRDLDVAAEAQGGRLLIRLLEQKALTTALHHRAIEGISERLRAVYAENAQLTSKTSSTCGTEVTLDIPLRFK